MQKKPYKKRVEKFSPHEVGPLLQVAQSKDKTEITEEHAWIAKLTAVEARNILLNRFASIIATLIEVCVKGKYFTSYTRTFLKLFGAQGKDMSSTAQMLKYQLSCYSKEELWHAGQVAILLAIENCETNLSSAIVYSFKDLIQKMIEDKNKQQPGLEVIENFAIHPNIDNLSLHLFVQTLTEEEQEFVCMILEGDKPTKWDPVKELEVEISDKEFRLSMPESLRVKFKEYLGPLYLLD